MHTLRRICLLAVGILMIMGSAMGSAPPITGATNETLESLIDSGELVTVIMKDRNAEDRNLRIIEAGNDHVTIRTRGGERYSYLFDSIRQIRVQEGREEVEQWRPAQGLGLLPAHQQIVARGVDRATALFDDGSANQNVRMLAAAILAVGGDFNERDMAIDYLHGLHESNDLSTALQAAFHLYHIGRREDVQDSVLEDGLTSGDRRVRASAAQVAGLIQRQGTDVHLYRMLRDRRADVSSPAARALARLGKRDIIPTLLEMITERNEERGEAAMFGLAMLGDGQTEAELETMLRTTEGMIRFRVAQVLYEMGNDTGRAVLRDEIMQVPTLQVEAAILLAPEGNAEAMRILRDRLGRRFDEVESTLMLRARMSAALIEGGDRTTVPYLQDLLRSDYQRVQIKVCMLLTELNIRQLMSIIQPAVESPHPGVAAAASMAAVSMAYPEFRERLVESWVGTD